MGAIAKYQKDGTLAESFAYTPTVKGIKHIGHEYFVIADWDRGTRLYQSVLVQITEAGLSITRILMSTGFIIQEGISFDGESYMMVHNVASIPTNKPNLRVYDRDWNLTRITQYTTIGSDARGIDFDGENIIILEDSGDNIYLIDPNTHLVNATVSLAAGDYRDICFDDEGYWVTDPSPITGTTGIRQLDRDGTVSGTFTLIGTYEGIGTDGEFLYIGS